MNPLGRLAHVQLSLHFGGVETREPGLENNTALLFTLSQKILFQTLIHLEKILAGHPDGAARS